MDRPISTYTWGQDSYDGLGDTLDDVADDNNEETFGVAFSTGWFST